MCLKQVGRQIELSKCQCKWKAPAPSPSSPLHRRSMLWEGAGQCVSPHSQTPPVSQLQLLTCPGKEQGMGSGNTVLDRCPYNADFLQPWTVLIEQLLAGLWILDGLLRDPPTSVPVTRISRLWFLDGGSVLASWLHRTSFSAYGYGAVCLRHLSAQVSWALRVAL